MDTRFYNTKSVDVEKLANDVENLYRQQGYQVQQAGNAEQKMIQLRKGGDLESLLGMQASLTVIFQRTAGGLVVTTGQQKWLDKAAIGAIGFFAAPVLWPLIFTAGAGAYRQVTVGAEVLNLVDGLVRQHDPESRPAEPVSPSSL